MLEVLFITRQLLANILHFPITFAMNLIWPHVASCGCFILGNYLCFLRSLFVLSFGIFPAWNYSVVGILGATWSIFESCVRTHRGSQRGFFWKIKTQSLKSDSLLDPVQYFEGPLSILDSTWFNLLAPTGMCHWHHQDRLLRQSCPTGYQMGLWLYCLIMATMPAIFPWMLEFKETLNGNSKAA